MQKALAPDPDDAPYVVALNLLSGSPKWLSAIHAAPMYLGLDLRGGVHFMLQVDMQAALTKKAEVAGRRPAQPAARGRACATAASAAMGRPSRSACATARP